jgi:hypothetical protein
MSRSLPPGRSTRPIEPSNSTSPENTTGVPSLSAVSNTTEPGVCPGASRTVSSRPARRSGWLSASSSTSAGSANVSCPNSGVPGGAFTPLHGSVSWARSAGWM